MTCQEFLRLMLAATPEPPSGECDPHDIIAAIDRFMPQRIELVARMQGSGTDSWDDEAAELRQCLRDRDNRWQAVLQRAQHTVRERSAALSRQRRAA